MNSSESSSSDNSTALEIEDLVLGPDGELINAKSRCGLCGKEIDLDDPDNWKLVKGWVGGPKKDSMRLRKDMGYQAHDSCVEKLQAGQAPDQPSLLEEKLTEDERRDLMPGAESLPGIFEE